MGKSFDKRLCEKMGWVPGDLLRVSPRTSLGFAWVSPKVPDGSEDLPISYSIGGSEIVMYIGPDDRHATSDWYFYLMTSSGSVVLGVRQDFTRVGNVKG